MHLLQLHTIKAEENRTREQMVKAQAETADMTQALAQAGLLMLLCCASDCTYFLAVCLSTKLQGCLRLIFWQSFELCQNERHILV